MGNFSKISFLFFIVILFSSGCRQQRPSTPALKPAEPLDSNLFCAFVPSKVKILPLTAFDESDTDKLTVYMNLLDAYNSKIKAPVILRLELYERSGSLLESRGKRVLLWPDIDLTEPEQNNIYWRDFLRAYEFELDFTPEPDQKYLLQITCVTPIGQRLTAAFNM